MRRLLFLGTLLIVFSKVQGQSFSYHLFDNTPNSTTIFYGSIDNPEQCQEVSFFDYPKINPDSSKIRQHSYFADGSLLYLGRIRSGFVLEKLNLVEKKVEFSDTISLRNLRGDLSTAHLGLHAPSDILIAPDSILYICDWFLLKYDMKTKELTTIGEVGVDSIPSLYIETCTWIDGELYASVQDYRFSALSTIIKVNISEPLFSTFIISTDFPIISIISMTTINYDCDSSKTILVNLDTNDANFYELDIKSAEIKHICSESGKRVTSIFSPSEQIRYDCIPILDLDEAENSGTNWLDYQLDTMCVLSGEDIFPLKEASASILTNTVVDSIWIGFIDGKLDAQNEIIGCADSNLDYDLTTSGLLFRNLARFENEAFIKQIKESFFYKNTSTTATAGVREIAFVTYKKQYLSDTAFLQIPIQSGIDAGIDAKIDICRNAPPIDLFSQLEGSPMRGGNWTLNGITQSGLFSPETDSSGSFQYTLTAEYCPDKSASVEVKINELPLFSLGADMVLCSGETGLLFPDKNGLQYQWQNGSIDTALLISVAGEYWLEITDSLGCKSRDTIEVTTAEHFRKDSLIQGCYEDLISFEGFTFTKDTSICKSGFTTSGCDSIFCLNVQFLPQYLDTIIATICKEETFILNGNTYTETGFYSENFLSQYGCDSSQVLNLNKISYPSLSILGDSILCNSETTELSIDGVFSSYQWSTGNTNSSIIVGPGQYAVTVTDAQNCSTKLSKRIKTKKCDLVYIPSAFSPNNDSVNDEFKVYPKGNIKVVNMKIYDRWGGMIFSSKGDKWWDGKWKGKNMSPGLYTYHLEIILPTGQSIIKNGGVNLLR